MNEYGSTWLQTESIKKFLLELLRDSVAVGERVTVRWGGEKKWNSSNGKSRRTLFCCSHSPTRHLATSIAPSHGGLTSISHTVIVWYNVCVTLRQPRTIRTIPDCSTRLWIQARPERELITLCKMWNLKVSTLQLSPLLGRSRFRSGRFGVGRGWQSSWRASSGLSKLPCIPSGWADSATKPVILFAEPCGSA